MELVTYTETPTTCRNGTRYWGVTHYRRTGPRSREPVYGWVTPRHCTPIAHSHWYQPVVYWGSMAIAYTGCAAAAGTASSAATPAVGYVVAGGCVTAVTAAYR